MKSKSGGWKVSGTSQVQAGTKQMKPAELNTFTAVFLQIPTEMTLKGFFFKGINSQRHTKRQRIQKVVAKFGKLENW